MRTWIGFALAAIATVAERSVAGAQGQITLEPNKTIQAGVRIVNQCKDDQSFRVSAEPLGTGWIGFGAGNLPSVGGNGSTSFPVTISTMGGMKPGQYKAEIVVVCESCRNSDPPCLQSEKRFPLTLFVPGDTTDRSGGGGAAGGRRTGGGAPPSPENSPPNPPAPYNRGKARPESEVGPRTHGTVAPTSPTATNPTATNPNDVPSTGTISTPPSQNGTVTNETPPMPSPTSPPILDWLLGGAIIGAGVATLLRGSGTPATTTPDGGAGQPAVAKPDDARVPIQPDRVPVGAIPIPTTNGEPTAPTEDIPGVPSGSTPQKKEPPGSWDAELDLPNTDTVPRDASVGSSQDDVFLQQSNTPPKKKEPPGSWDAELDLPAQDRAAIQQPSYTTPIIATEYFNPETGEGRSVPDDWVKLGPTPPLEGPGRGLVMGEYPIGKEPRLYVNPKTGEQQWFDWEDDPPPGWVKKDPLIPGYFDGPSSEYMNPRTGAVTRVPDNWVKLDPTPPLPGAGGLIMPEYIPGREPRLYVDPQTGEQQWVMYKEKPPQGWVEKKFGVLSTVPIGDVDGKPSQPASVQPKKSDAAIAQSDQQSKPDTMAKSTAPAEEKKPTLDSAPAMAAPGDLNAGGGHTFSKGTTKEDLDRANKPLTDPEKAAAKVSSDGADDYADRERATRDGIGGIGAQRDSIALQDEFFDKNIERIRAKVAAEAKSRRTHYNSIERARREERLKQMKAIVAKAEQDGNAPLDIGQMELDFLERGPSGLILDKLSRDKFIDFLKKSIVDYEQDLAQDSGEGFLSDKAKLDNSIAEKQKDRDAFVSHFDVLGETAKSFFGGLWDWADGGKLDTYKSMRARRDWSDDDNAWRKKENVSVLYAHRRDLEDRIAKGEQGLEYHLAVAQYQVDLYEQTKRWLREADLANKNMYKTLRRVNDEIVRAKTDDEKAKWEADRIDLEDRIRKNNAFIDKYQANPAERVNEMNDQDRMAIQEIFNGLLTSKGQGAASQGLHMAGQAAAESSIGRKAIDKVNVSDSNVKRAEQAGKNLRENNYGRSQPQQVAAAGDEGRNAHEGPKHLVHSTDKNVPPRPQSRPKLTNLAGPDLDLFHFGEKLKPEPGYHDVVMHGNPKQGGIYIGKGVEVFGVLTVADSMRRTGYKGGPVRLISCRTGELPEGFAKKLADELNARYPNSGVVVLASDKDVAFRATGEVTRPIDLKPHFPAATGPRPIPPYLPLGPKTGTKVAPGKSQTAGAGSNASGKPQYGMPANDLGKELEKVRPWQDKETEGGTVAVAKTNIPGMNKEILVGKSGSLHKNGWRWTKETDIQSDHPIEYKHAEEDIANQLLAKFEKSGKDFNEIKGTVLVHVDQKLCNACRDSYKDYEGPLGQLSERYPNVRIEVTNSTNGAVVVFDGGVPTFNPASE